MIWQRVMTLIQERGWKYFVYKVVMKFCRQIDSFDFTTARKPLPEFVYMGVTPTNNPEIETLRLRDSDDYALELPFKGNLHVKKSAIAAIIHIYYPELSSEILRYLRHIPLTTDLYISTDTDAKKSEILQQFSHYGNGSIVVKVVANRGRDIAPMLVGFKDVFDTYDYFIHLHSKKSPHSDGGLLDWRQYLFENLLGSEAIVRSHLYLLEHHVGVVFPQHFAPLRININWGYDFTMLKQLLKRMGVALNSEQLLEFPSGSMFWGRTDAIKPLLDLELSYSDFPRESGQIDGTLAHAIERSFLYVCEIAHYKWAKVARREYYPLKKTLLPTSVEQIDTLLPRVYRPLFNRYVDGGGRLDSTLPEYSRYNTYPSSCSKPRLNLMVPTINAKEIFGGIATALRVYNALQTALGHACDYRIIVDIGKISEETKANFPRYHFATNVIDDTVAMQVVETVEHKQLHIRKDDLFLATAWWTASSALYLLEDQERFFNVSHKLLYLIQDYESHFNAWSASWIFAENTYKASERIIAILNSEELALFMSRRYDFYDTYYLPYTINAGIQKQLQSVTRKRQILFYGRPTVARNTFDIIVDALALWQKRNPITSQSWQIVSLGEQYPDTYVSHVEHLHIMGKAPLHEYATLLSESMIGISLMVSPHPSYPPLEMAYAGMKTITNSYEGKDLSQRSDTIVSLDILSVEAIAETLERLCDEIETNGFSTTEHGVSALDIDMKPFCAQQLSDSLWS
ncbi:MAG: hypothetical protein DSZ03_06380 [Sulfurimonas sp.]|nr:MAG: hypothetical protein DSZ03_06380 [Sulfurimonas sp.]